MSNDISTTGGVSAYPPERHLEHGVSDMHAVMQRYPFAAVISAEDGEVYVTQVPLILDANRGTLGFLFGHMDRANPHISRLLNREVFLLFNGPNSYITPFTYTTNQLPTWNSISVHAKGRVTIIEDKGLLVRGLQSICESADPQVGAYRLHADDSRIPKLIDYIVGFEIEITSLVGRFKLSQDRQEHDRLLAAKAMIEMTKRDESDVIMRAFHIS